MVVQNTLIRPAISWREGRGGEGGAGTLESHDIMVTVQLLHIIYTGGLLDNPYNGLLQSLYDWVGFHPLYTLNNQVFFFAHFTSRVIDQPVIQKILE